MYALAYKGTDRLHSIIRKVPDPGNYDLTKLDVIEVPEQDIRHLFSDNDGIPESDACIGDLQKYTDEEKACLIDRDTGSLISSSVHPFCGTDEQLGILRDAITRIYNGDMTPSEDFTRLNDIAIAEVKKARLEKEAING